MISSLKIVPINDPNTIRRTTFLNGDSNLMSEYLIPIIPKKIRQILPRLSGEPGIEKVKEGIKLASNKNGTHSISVINLKLLNIVLDFDN